MATNTTELPKSVTDNLRLSGIGTSISESLKMNGKIVREGVVLIDTFVQSPENKLDTFHPSFNTNLYPIQCDSEDYSWKARKLDNEVDLQYYFKNVELEQRNFVDALQNFEETMDGNCQKQFDAGFVHNLSDIQDLLDSALSNYDAKTSKTFMGPIRKAFRKLGGKNELAKGYLALAPQESHYLSIVCGGIKLILSAAARMAELQESVRKTMEDVPEIVKYFQRILAVYRNSKSLKDLCMSLYVSILQVLSHILDFMKKKTYKKVFGVLLSQGEYEKELIRRISAMNLLYQTVKEEAVLISQEIERKTAEDVDEISQIAKENYRGIRVVEQLQKADLAQNFESAENVRQILHLVKCFASSPELQEAVKYLPMKHKNDNLRQPLQNVVPSQKDIRRTLTLLLHYNTMQLDTYLPDLLGLSVTLKGADQDRAVWVMKSDVFMGWLSSPLSMPLLVNGKSRAPRNNRSPLTFVAAKLVESLERLRMSNQRTWTSGMKLIGLSFFCGEHEDETESENNNPLGLVSNLFVQLMKQCKHVDLTPLSNMEESEGYDGLAVLHRFKMLLSLLPKETVVFCIIDALSTYGNDDRQEMADIIMKDLVGLTRVSKKEPAPRCQFKLLLLEPMGYGLPGVSKLWEDEILEVPVRLGKGNGFHDMDWELDSIG